MNHSKESAKAKAKAHKKGESKKSKDGKMPEELLEHFKNKAKKGKKS